MSRVNYCQGHQIASFSFFGSHSVFSQVKWNNLEAWAQSNWKEEQRNWRYSAISAGSGSLRNIFLNTICPASIPDIRARRTPCEEEGSETLAASPATKYPGPAQDSSSRQVTSHPLGRPIGSSPANSGGGPSRRGGGQIVNRRVQWKRFGRTRAVQTQP